jgi:predicted nuclease of restriction endonuclease-like (RecB) superfamily
MGRLAMRRKKREPLYARVRDILESARSSAARSVNTAQVAANWLIGREIVEEEQQGKGRAGYGARVLTSLSRRLEKQYGSGFSVSALQYLRAFYLDYPGLLEKQHAARVKSDSMQIAWVMHPKSWKPGLLHPSLSWTHYRALLRVEKTQARAFYEIEAIKDAWSARELERQINSLLYERLALSKDKKGLLRLAKKGQEIQSAADLFKDPMVMEFTGVPTSPKLVESDLEQSLIDNLQTFLLELGKGVCFRLPARADHH